MAREMIAMNRFVHVQCSALAVIHLLNVESINPSAINQTSEHVAVLPTFSLIRFEPMAGPDRVWRSFGAIGSLVAPVGHHLPFAIYLQPFSFIALLKWQ